jgi:hypothetical protein
MTSPDLISPLTGRCLVKNKREGKTLEAQPWGTPTGQEVERLLDTVQQTIDGALVCRSQAIGLLIECHMMLHRCHGALAPIEPVGRKGR